MRGNRGSQSGSRFGREENKCSEAGRDKKGEYSGRKTHRGAGLFRCRSLLCGAKPCGRGDEERTGHSTADRCLGQGNIHRCNTHPHECQQQAIGNKADDGRESWASGHGPDGHAQHQQGQCRIKHMRRDHTG